MKQNVHYEEEVNELGEENVLITVIHMNNDQNFLSYQKLEDEKESRQVYSKKTKNQINERKLFHL